MFKSPKENHSTPVATPPFNRNRRQFWIYVLESLLCVGRKPIPLPLIELIVSYFISSWNLIGGTNDGKLVVLDGETFEPITEAKNATNYVIRCIVTLPNGHEIATASDSTIEYWEFRQATKLKSVAVLKDHTGVVHCLCAINDSWLASGSSDKTVRIWNNKSKRCEQMLIGHEDDVLSLATVTVDRGTSHEQLCLVSADNNGLIRLWKLSHLFISNPKPHPNPSSYCLAAIRLPQHSFYDFICPLYNIVPSSTPTSLVSMNHKSTRNTSSNDAILISVSFQKIVHWKIEHDRKRDTWNFRHLRSYSINENETESIFVNQHGVVINEDSDHQLHIRHLSHLPSSSSTDLSNYLYELALTSSLSRQLITGGRMGGSIGGGHEYVLIGHTGFVNSEAVLCLPSKQIVTGGQDGHILIWDLSRVSDMESEHDDLHHRHLHGQPPKPIVQCASTSIDIHQPITALAIIN